jgi:hypothetical protein
MKILHVALGLTLGLSLPTVSAAQTPGSAAGLALRAGTLGGGIEVATTLMPNLNLRLGANSASYSYTIRTTRVTTTNLTCPCSRLQPWRITTC